jgi:hypothetical protein
MGISADLIEFGSGDRTIDDLNSDITLYEFLPEHLHQFIQQIDVEVIDDQYYRELFNDPTLILFSWDSTDGIVYLPAEQYNANIRDEEFLIRVPHPVKTAVARVNSIAATSLGYIGGREEFKSNIYELYDSRKHFPYLWSWDASDVIMDTVPDSLVEKVAANNAERIYIDLGY